MTRILILHLGIGESKARGQRPAFLLPSDQGESGGAGNWGTQVEPNSH